MRKINIGNLPQKKELPDLPIDKTKKFLSVEDDVMSWDEVSKYATMSEVNTTIQTLIDTIVGED